MLAKICPLVLVTMMHVWKVRVPMRQWFVPMPMTVRLFGRVVWFVLVLMVLIMNMAMLMP
jgi:hypothetical protein